MGSCGKPSRKGSLQKTLSANFRKISANFRRISSRSPDATNRSFAHFRKEAFCQFFQKKQQNTEFTKFFQSGPQKFTKSDFSGLAPTRRVLTHSKCEFMCNGAATHGRSQHPARTWLTRMFEGFKSRCTMPAECRYNKPLRHKAK